MGKEFIDPATGELIEMSQWVTTHEHEAYQKYKAVAKEKEEAVKRAKTNGATFVQVIKDGVKFDELLQLKNKQLGYFLILQTYVDYENVLCIGRKPMNKTEMRKALGISASKHFNTLLDGFVEQGLIFTKPYRKNSKEYLAYAIPDKYCFKGEASRDKVKVSIRVFVDKLQQVYAQKKVNPADIGLIYKAMQFLHYDTNYLVYNPDERSTLTLNPLRMEDFAEIAGISRKELYKKISNLTYPCEYEGAILDMAVFVQAKARCGFIKLNPFIAWRKAGEPASSVSVEFIMDCVRRNKK